jgi:hypothetical protein
VLALALFDHGAAELRESDVPVRERSIAGQRWRVYWPYGNRQVQGWTEFGGTWGGDGIKRPVPLCGSHSKAQAALTFEYFGSHALR